MTTYVYGQVDPNPNPNVGKGGYGGDPDHDLHDEAHARRQPTTSTCRDAIWAILFIIHLAIVMGFGFHYFHLYKNDMWSSARTNLDDRKITTHGTSLIIIVFLCGMAMSMFWLWLAKSQARLLIQISLYFSIAMNILVLIWMIYLRATAGIIIMVIALVFNVLWVWAVQSRIPFATVILEISITAIKLYPAQIYTAVLFLIAQILWIVTWVISFSSIMWVLNDKQTKPTNQQNGFTVFALLISLYWTAQVIKNVNHTMVAGVVGNWYFFYPSSMPRNPTLHSFRRATTTSLGSICLGSLIVAIVQAIRAILQSMANRDRDNAAGACLACIADCILGCIESIITYINKYAFTHVGLYGKPYCTAAHDAFELLTRRGLDAVVNDSLINGVLWMGCVITGLICALIMAILTRVVWIENYWWAWALAGFLTGFILCACTMDIVESAVTTIFVCLAEDPNALADTKPELYERLVPALEEVYPDVNLRPLVGGHHA